jgi:hypothetical protein
MSVIAEVTVEGDFALSELLTELPDIRIQLERVIPAGDRTYHSFGFILMILSQSRNTSGNTG